MMQFLTTRGGLTASTALVAVAFVALTPMGQNLLTPKDVTEVVGGLTGTAAPEPALQDKAAAPKPDKRFHYRYVASELAAKAARLLPKSSETAGIYLCFASKWLLLRDPPAGQAYYKEFMRRNYMFPRVSANFGMECPEP